MATSPTLKVRALPRAHDPIWDRGYDVVRLLAEYLDGPS